MGNLERVARKFLSEVVTLVPRPEGGPQGKAFQAGHSPRSHNKLGVFEDSKGSHVAGTQGGRER